MSFAHPNATPPAILAARQNAKNMTDAQKIAFAIELANGVHDINCTTHLTRLAEVARSTSSQITQNHMYGEVG